MHEGMSQFVVGLTGGIGSGKSAASDWFAAQGICVIDADQLAREAVKPGSEALNQIRQHFGDWVIHPDGGLDRSKLRDFVFSDPKAKQALEAIIHPVVAQLAELAIDQASSSYVVLAVPLLFEHPDGLIQLCSRTLCIDVPESLQRSRAAMRDQLNQDQIRAVMATQIAREQRVRKSDDVIDNSGSLDQLYSRLEPLHSRYRFYASRPDEAEWAK